MTQILPNENISGNHFNCEYTIEPSFNRITIKGDSIERIDEFIKQITRSFCRKQSWGFHYKERITQLSGQGQGEVMIPARVSIVDPFHDKFSVINAIQEEYQLPRFLELLFREAILNYSAKKYRVAFLLLYTALEKALRLIYEFHYNKQSSSKIQIDKILEELIRDPQILLNVDVNDFKSQSNFRDIRNTIAHGEREFRNKNINLKREVKTFFEVVDSIFYQLSNVLDMYKHHL